jgi:hypothetical protein
VRYVDSILGDKERVVLQTHQHVIVLVLRAALPLLTLLVLLALGLVALIGSPLARQRTGWIALATVAWPVYMMVAAYVRGARGVDLLREIWRPVLGAGAIIALAIVLRTVQQDQSPPLIGIGVLALLVALIPLGYAVQIILDWINERYIITNRRVMEVTGIINKHARDSALEKVNDVDMTQSILGRLLRYGTVQIITGSDIGLNRFQRIANPVRFKRVMLNQKEALGLLDGHEIGTAHLQAPTPTPPGDIPTLIAALDDLRRQGILTDDEFKTKKQQLLDRLQ